MPHPSSRISRFTAARVAGLFIMLGLLATPAAVLAQTETIEYYGTDAIGSIRIVWDANGNMTARQDFTPFGEPVLQEGTSLPKEGFAGNETDAETSQDYFHARMLEPRTGRFTRPDPIEDGVADPQRWNRYGYASNSPLGFIDPDGLQISCPSNPGPDNPCTGASDGETVIGDGSDIGLITANPPTGDPDCTSLPAGVPGNRSIQDCSGTGGEDPPTGTGTTGTPKPHPTGVQNKNPVPPDPSKGIGDDPRIPNKAWPSCNSLTIYGDVGLITIQSAGPGTVAWQARMYDPNEVGYWAVQEAFTRSNGVREYNSKGNLQVPFTKHNTPHGFQTNLKSGSRFVINAEYWDSPFFGAASGSLTCTVQ